MTNALDKIVRAGGYDRRPAQWLWRGMAAAAAVLALAGPGSATTTIFVGQDDGVGPGATIPLSRAAQQAFLLAASAFGPVLTDGFETADTGYYSPLVLDGLTISYSTTPFGDGISGVSDIDFGSALYGFNTTPNGQKWLGFPDFIESVANFTFDEETYAFGFFMTGVQADQTSEITLHLLDGSLQSFALPVNLDGGVAFFGVTDSLGFTGVTLSQTNLPGYADAWGIDDVSFNNSQGAVGTTPTVPEPAAWALLIAGFGMVGIAQRRTRRRPVTNQ